MEIQDGPEREKRQEINTRRSEECVTRREQQEPRSEAGGSCERISGPFTRVPIVEQPAKLQLFRHGGMHPPDRRDPARADQPRAKDLHFIIYSKTEQRRGSRTHEVPGADGAEAVNEVDEDEPRAGRQEEVGVRQEGRRRAEQVNRGGAAAGFGPHGDA